MKPLVRRKDQEKGAKETQRKMVFVGVKMLVQGQRRGSSEVFLLSGRGQGSISGFRRMWVYFWDLEGDEGAG